MRLTYLLACTLWLATAPITAHASGTVTIAQVGGEVDSYSDVGIKVIHNVLYITTADGKGTLVISRAACSYQGQILVCLPTAATLVQAGSVKPLELNAGTIYVNLTQEKQQLPLSSVQLPPRGVLLSLTTKRGTIVNLNGLLDKVTK